MSWGSTGSDDDLPPPKVSLVTLDCFVFTSVTVELNIEGLVSPLQPARPGYPGFQQLSPTGSTPNLLAANSYTPKPPPLRDWGSTTQLSTASHHSTDLGGSTNSNQPMGYNTFAHPVHRPRHQVPPPLPSGSYAASAPNQPPLGYIVAYTPEQVADLMRDQYQAGFSSQRLDMSPAASPKRPSSGLVSVYPHKFILPL